MKTILIPISGHDSDEAILDAAYAVALPLGAHLDFVHILVDVAAAAKSAPDVDFARGSGLDLALRKLRIDCEGNAVSARRHVEDFCQQWNIAEVTSPGLSDRVTASWRMLEDEDAQYLLALARHRDLVVMGRSTTRHPRSLELTERLLTDCGRPVLLVPSAWNASPVGTIAVWWKEHAAAARALTAAMPLLVKANRVTFLSADEDGARTGERGTAIACQLGWHGIRSDAREVPRSDLPTVDRLWHASVESQADLVVMGAFSHSRMHELFFGGCTQAVLEAGPLPVLLLH